jgi:hypothetical protein
MLLAAASTSLAAAEPRRATREHAVTGGLAVIGAGGGEALPFVTAQGVVDVGPRVAAVADTSGDRVFGPRLLLRAGMRMYVRDGASNPFVAIGGVAYHHFDVDYSASDASQSASSALGYGATLGHELITGAGLSWVIEATVFQLHELSGSAPHGLSWQADSTLGYRF